MSKIADVLPGVAVSDFESALPWYENLFGRPADDRAGKSTVTLVLDDVKAYYEELEQRGLTPEALDETTSEKVLFSFIDDPEGNRIALVEWRPGQS